MRQQVLLAALVGDIDEAGHGARRPPMGSLALFGGFGGGFIQGRCGPL